MVAPGRLRNIPVEGQDSRWFALHTMSHCEAKVAGYIQSFGIEVFYPDYPSRREWHDRVKILRRSLFPGYCFARFQQKLPAPAWSAPGLIQVVSFADGPVPIPDEEIASVRKIVDCGLSICGCPMLNVGQRVRMRSGPFEGVEGRLEKIKTQFRLVVSMELLGRSVAVEVDPDATEVLN